MFSRTPVPPHAFIKKELGRLGWIAKDPARTRAGQVYARGECLAERSIGDRLGTDHPEVIVKLSESEFYVIAARPDRSEIGLALEEAEGRFAARMNQGGQVAVRIISGVAGDSRAGFVVQSRIMVDRRFVPIVLRGEELTGLVSPSLARHLVDRDTNRADDVPVDEARLASAAEAINTFLHNGAIAAPERGKVIASLLLSLATESDLDQEVSPAALVDAINVRAAAILRDAGRERSAADLRIALPAARANHEKYKSALVRSVRLLLGLNLRSAMNAGVDPLGRFLEAFLKYGNWARQSGIVLTPRHVARFAAEILDVSGEDVVYDPTCGTGGFLIAAVDRAPTSALFGVEQEPSIAALAVANMVFRGGGDALVKESSCFHEGLHRTGDDVTVEFVDREFLGRIAPVTKVLMNPPFALKHDDEQEHKFVDHALAQMRMRGLLFAILPDSELIREGAALRWRREVLLAGNTLRAVISFPEDLFYPVAGKHTCGIVVEKGVPHDFAADVLWVKVRDDGRVKRKKKRVADAGRVDDLARSVDRVAAFLRRGTVPKPVARFLKAAPIADPDGNLELVPEVHLDNHARDLEGLRAGIQERLRGLLSFAILEGTFPYDRLSSPPETDAAAPPHPLRWSNARIKDLFEIVNGYPAGSFRLSPATKAGSVPLFRPTSNVNNLVAGWVERTSQAERKIHPAGSLIVSTDGEGSHTYAYVAPVAFVPNSNTAVLVPRAPMPLSFLLFASTAITDERWRFSYGRKPKGHRLRDLTFSVPARDEGEIDLLAFETMARSMAEYPIVLTYFESTNRSPTMDRIPSIS